MEDARTPLRQTVRLIAVVVTIASALVGASAANETSGDEVYPLTFPVAGSARYGDTWGAPRSEGRTHKGADIFAVKGTPVVAGADGTVVRIAIGERAGRYIVVEHPDGWRTYYLHLDNDTPGTDDGLGGAPAPGIVVGAQVVAGQTLDYVGDSGNAEATPSHLHFELHRPDGTAINPTPHLRAAQSPSASEPHRPGTERSAAVPPPTYRAVNAEVVGRFDPGTGFAAGVSVHDGVAYMGTWGRPSACPATGVRVIDVSDPEAPELLGALATGDEFPGTSADSVWVGEIESVAFSGVVAVAAVRLCDTSERHRLGGDFRGLAFYDVTNPASPALLATLHSGERTQGVHEIAAAVRDDGTLLVGATVMQSLLHTGGERGDLRLIDATNPLAPVEVEDWDFRRDAPHLIAGTSLEGADQIDLHVHSLSFADDGRMAWVGVWDAGIVGLNVATPAAPAIVTHVLPEAGSEGNVHSVIFDDTSGLLVRVDEDLSPRDTERHAFGWGGQTVYDAADSAQVSVLSTFEPEAAAPDDGTVDLSGYFSGHEAVYVDGIEYVSWYSAGLRIVDLSDPTSPEEIGSFVPPATRDPQRHWVAPDGSMEFPMVWGVAVDEELIYVSDMHTGLWIIRRAREAPAPRAERQPGIGVR